MPKKPYGLTAQPLILVAVTNRHFHPGAAEDKELKPHSSEEKSWSGFTEVPVPESCYMTQRHSALPLLRVPPG